MTGASVAGLPYPIPSSAAATATMRANRRTETAPELALRSALHRRGFRFRADFPVVAAGRRVRIDIAFPKRRVAVFVDGCFWHGCPKHSQTPRANPGYWLPKLERNRLRDARNNDDLVGEGWRVIRIWEHEPTQAACDCVVATLSLSENYRAAGKTAAN